MRVPEALTPLRDRRFAWYYTARLVSTTGSMMAPVALAFAVLGIDRSASALGQVLAARTIPMVLLLLFGGVLADRFDRSAVMKVSNLLSALTGGAVAALVLTHTATVGLVIGLEVVNGAVSAFTFPAMAGIVSQLAPRSHLRQANALLSFSRGGLSILGPSVAALLVVTVGAGWALAFDSLTWLLAALCMTRIRLPRNRPADAGESSSMLRELREGWSVFTGHTWLWVVVLAFGVLNLIHSGAYFTLGPALAKQTFGARGWGCVLSAESFGLLLMTVVMLRVNLRRPLLVGMLGCACFGVPLFLLGAYPHVPVLVLATFLSGMGMELFSLGWNLAMQENIDDEVLSRAYSYDALGSFVAMPVGQLVYGPLAAAFGFRDVLVVSAVVYTAVALLALTSRSVRDLRRSPGVPEPEPVAV
ncbi:MAG: MFS transporter [Nocardioidaceae bacterium]